MALGVGPGPVFVYESLILARRRQVYAGRALFVFTLLIGLASAWWSADLGASPSVGAMETFQGLARAGQKFFYALAAIQLAMVLLAAPAATAGAICHDRARGIFAQLAATDLSDAEIVLGKLGSRLAPILGVLACALPVTALAALLGGIDMQALFSLFVVSVAIAVLGCTLALAISVRATKTHDVIIAALALWMLWLLSLPIWSGMSTLSGVVPPPDWFKKANPVLLVYAPYSWPGYVEPMDVAAFVAVVLLISTGLAAWTIATVRRGVLEPPRRVRLWDRPILGGRGPRLARWLAWLPSPSLDGNPVLWREWHRNRPSRLAQIVWAVYAVGSVAGVGIGIEEAIVNGLDKPQGFFALVIALHLQFLFGLMMLTSLAPTSLAEERVRGSLDVLMATPLSSRSIAWGKWLGTYRIVLWLAILPALAAGFVAALVPAIRAASSMSPLTLLDRIAAAGLVVGEMLTYGAAITSMGLALATWVPRLGRAIAINMVIFVLITVGWPLFFESVIWPPLRAWLATRWNQVGMDLRWLNGGMMVSSPFAAPILTLEWILENRGAGRGKFWLLALGWCLLAWALAAALFWAALRSFDRCLGRMPETSASGPEQVEEAASARPGPHGLAATAPSPRLAEDGVVRQNSR
jgi:ABC-type transport system involved in multi-copper enzyme maturation permease subunit